MSPALVSSYSLSDTTAVFPVIPSGLLFPISLIALASWYYGLRLQRNNTPRASFLVFIAALSLIAGVIGIINTLNHAAVLARVADALLDFLECALSGMTLYVLYSCNHCPATSFRRVRVILGFTGFLILCELTSSLIPQSPFLLPPILAVLSRVLILFVALCVIAPLRSLDTAGLSQDVEKGPTEKSPAAKTSPTPDVWPFLASLVHTQIQRKNPARNQVEVASLPQSSALTPSSQPGSVSAENEKGTVLHLAMPLIAAQTAAAICATLDVACTLIDNNPKVGDRDKAVARIISGLLVAHSVCLLVWAAAVLVLVYLPSFETCWSASKKRGIAQDSADRYDKKLVPMPRKPKASLTRFGSSDSASDFLSMRDPFASPPPPPPPPPAPVGLGLNEIDVGWNGNKEIAMQYRFPAPRSKVKAKVKDRRKTSRANGKKSLAHQLSAQTLLPRPPLPNSNGTDADKEKDKSFRDEARLAQMLLQSLNQNIEECESPVTPTSPALLLPQPTHVALSSRWSASTTIRSATTGSTGRRSGVSTYASCTSEKVRGSRMSMNTVASGPSSRKSSEARKSSAAGSPSRS